LVRSHVKWRLKRDSGTKEFYQAVKPKTMQSCITELVNSEGVSCFDQNQMEEICHSFYRDVYKRRVPNQDIIREQAEVLTSTRDRLSLNMKAALQQLVTLAGLTKALNEMAKQRALGPDGVTIEFYLALWHVMGQQFLEMIHNSIGKGRLPLGVTDIALLHKSGTRSSLNQWKSITLLKTLYKVFAKALQPRLQSILMEIISPDQFVFLSLKFILNNIFLTHETILTAKRTNQPLVFLELDFSKA
jgi:hypothetical protein